MSSGDGKDPERPGEPHDEPSDSGGSSGPGGSRRPTPAPRGRGLGLRASHPVSRRLADEDSASTPPPPPDEAEPTLDTTLPESTPAIPESAVAPSPPPASVPEIVVPESASPDPISVSPEPTPEPVPSAPVSEAGLVRPPEAEPSNEPASTASASPEPPPMEPPVEPAVMAPPEPIPAPPAPVEPIPGLLASGSIPPVRWGASTPSPAQTSAAPPVRPPTPTPIPPVPPAPPSPPAADPVPASVSDSEVPAPPPTPESPLERLATPAVPPRMSAAEPVSAEPVSAEPVAESVAPEVTADPVPTEPVAPELAAAPEPAPEPASEAAASEAVASEPVASEAAAAEPAVPDAEPVGPEPAQAESALPPEPASAASRVSRSRGVRGLVLASLGFGGVGALAIGALVVVLVAVILWFTLHTRVMFALWDRTAGQALSATERGQLAACESPGWGGWIRAITADIELACGEDWAVTAFAERIGSPDRAAWLSQRFSASPPGAQMRIATALAIAGYPPPREPAWLVADLPESRRAMWTLAAFRSDAVGLHAGPSVAAAAAIARAEAGQLDPAVVLPALEWFATVGDPAAEADAVRVAAALAEATPEAVETLRQQRLSGRSLTLPVPTVRWTRTMLAHPECPPRCGVLWTELLAARLSDDAIDLGVPLPDGPAEPPLVGELSTASGASLAERRALAFGVKAAADWVAAAPDPASRLRSLAARRTGHTSSITRIPWDGTGLPFTSAVVLQAVGGLAGVEVEVRVGDQNQVWLRIGGVDVTRSCGAPGSPPSGPAWPAPAVLAAALGEQAGVAAEGGHTLDALRLASTAERLDPLVGGPLVVKMAQTVPPELSGGRRVGLALLRPSPPVSAAEPSRRRAGEQALLQCPSEAPGPAPTAAPADPPPVEVEPAPGP